MVDDLSQPVQRLLRQRLVCFGASLALLALGLGCKPSKSPQPKTAEPPPVSSVPLQLWIVSPVAEVGMVQRQWLSGSEQPMEVRSISTADFLAAKAPNCDVVLYPARMLGELVDRKWIAKLPKSISLKGNEEFVVPGSWLEQVGYGAEMWAIPLGTSYYVPVANEAAGASLAQINDWPSLSNALQATAPESDSAAIDATKIDRDALVDTYFTIVGGLSARPAMYGLLFELQTMKPRLTEAECQQAAEVLQRLYRQGIAPEFLAGKSQDVWNWLASRAQPAVGLLAPSQLRAADSQVANCKPLALGTLGWNTGAGLVASLSANCRQSGRATLLLSWLQKPETRQSLSAIVPGIQATMSMTSADIGLPQVNSRAAELSTIATQSHELRLPRAEEYRSALADALVEILQGAAPPREALEKAAAKWQKITESRGRLTQRADYERSLGLTHD